jgi:predicted RNase H-like HicB family nuclease
VKLTVRYHDDDGCYWAESPEVPGFTAAGDDLADVRKRVFAALRDIVGAEADVTEIISGLPAMPAAANSAQTVVVPDTSVSLNWDAVVHHLTFPQGPRTEAAVVEPIIATA